MIFSTSHLDFFLINFFFQIDRDGLEQNSSASTREADTVSSILLYCNHTGICKYCDPIFSFRAWANNNKNNICWEQNGSETSEEADNTRDGGYNGGDEVCALLFVNYVSIMGNPGTC